MTTEAKGGIPMRRDSYRIPQAVRRLPFPDRAVAVAAINADIHHLLQQPRPQAPITIFEPHAYVAASIEDALGTIPATTVHSTPQLPTEYPVPFA